MLMALAYDSADSGYARMEASCDGPAGYQHCSHHDSGESPTNAGSLPLVYCAAVVLHSQLCSWVTSAAEVCLAAPAHCRLPV